MRNMPLQLTRLMMASVNPVKYIRQNPRKQLVSIIPETEPGTPRREKESARKAYLMEVQILNDIVQSVRITIRISRCFVPNGFSGTSGSFSHSEII